MVVKMVAKMENSLDSKKVAWKADMMEVTTVGMKVAL